MQLRLQKGVKACNLCRRTSSFTLHFRLTNSLDDVSLASLVEERLKKFLLADRAIVVLVHGTESFLELLLVEVAIGLDPLEHLSAKLAHLALLQRTVAVGVDTCKQFFSNFSELCLCHLGHFTFAKSS